MKFYECWTLGILCRLASNEQNSSKLSDRDLMTWPAKSLPKTPNMPKASLRLECLFSKISSWTFDKEYSDAPQITSADHQKPAKGAVEVSMIFKYIINNLFMGSPVSPSFSMFFFPIFISICLKPGGKEISQPRMRGSILWLSAIREHRQAWNARLQLLVSLTMDWTANGPAISM